jgi:hypothetical protein
MRSCRAVKASGCQCWSCNSPGFDLSILRHSGIWGAADESVLNKVKEEKNPKISPCKKEKRRKIGGFLWPERNPLSPEVSESHFTESFGMATGSGRILPEVAVCHRTSLTSPEVAVCHRKWPCVTGRRLCHRKWPYVTGSGRMSPELCRSCLSYCEPDVDRACWPKIIQYLYTVVYCSKNSCSIPINTKTMTTKCGLIKSFTHKNQWSSAITLPANCSGEGIDGWTLVFHLES